MPEVSVLMPVYNAAAFLKESIESILSQTFADFEFIIINDGSTDHSEQIIIAYKDPRIRYIKNETNLGLVHSLNHGLKISQGLYIARMDADDIAVNKRLQLQVHFLQNNHTIHMVGSFIEEFNANGVVKLRKYPVSPKEIRWQLIKSTTFAHPAVMFCKSLITGGDFYYNSAYYTSEDYELFTRLALKYNLANIPIPLIKYRLHQDQVSTSKRVEQLKMRNIVKQKYIASLLYIQSQSLLNRCFLFYTNAPALSLGALLKLFPFLFLKSLCVKNINNMRFMVFSVTVFIKSFFKKIIALSKALSFY